MTPPTEDPAVSGRPTASGDRAANGAGPAQGDQAGGPSGIGAAKLVDGDAGAGDPDGVDPGAADPDAADPGAAGSGTSRRNVLLTLLGGTVGGGLVGATVPGRLRRPWPGGSGGRALAVHGGDDIDGARANALQVWALTPPNLREHRRATYTGVGARSTEQIDRVKNLLTRRATDLVVIDPQYLAELAGAGQIRPFDEVSSRSLADLGCYPGLVSQCEVDGRLHALPLNADAPMLVVNLSLLSADGRRRVAALTDVNDPKTFWTEAAAIAAGATKGSGTVRFQTGDYEGLTVCLVELICAFGGDVAADPGLTTPENLDALRGIRSVFAEPAFLNPGGSRGDEAATATAVARGEAAVARLWPAQTHGLISATPAEEDGAAEYAVVPVPGGVLGGQVLALPGRSSNRPVAQEVARYLAEPMAQLQLFTAAGYVPTLRPVHAVTGVDTELRQLGSRLGNARLRPTLAEYTRWSARFRTVVRDYLVHATDNLDTDVTQPLAPFADT